MRKKGQDTIKKQNSNMGFVVLCQFAQGGVWIAKESLW